MITQNETEKAAYGLWIESRIKQEKHTLTLSLESFTDPVKDVIHNLHISGIDIQVDEALFSLMNKFLEVESFIMNHIESSDMARNSLNERMKKELEDPTYMQSDRYPQRRIL